MRNLFTVLVFVLFCINAKSQNWQLFPKDQRFYYADGYSSGKFRMYCMDSIENKGTFNVLYFNTRNRINELAACYNSGVVKDINSLVQHNDTVFYNSNGKTVYFLPNTKPGDSWTITSDLPGNSYNKITIKCDSYIDSCYSNYPLYFCDSLKTFSIKSNGTLDLSWYEIILSKNHGLLKYIPFEQFIVHPDSIDFVQYNVFGLKKEGNIKPTFNDYFHLSAGDVLKWHYTYTPSFSTPNDYFTEHYYRDSILSVSKTPDSISYLIDRVSLNNNQLSHTNTAVQKYFRKDYSDILDCNEEDIGVDATLYIQKVTSSKNKFNTTLQDSIYTISYHNSFEYIDSDLCNYFIGIDNWTNKTLNTYQGIIEDISASIWHESKHLLIGSRINGVEWGNISPLVTGISELGKRSAISLNPNPAKDILNISTILPTNSNYSITNIVGLSVKSGIINTATLSISDLDSGLYYITIQDSGYIWNGKFIKE